MNRTTLSLIVVVAALAAVFGIASATAPSSTARAATAAPDTQDVGVAAQRKPIQRSTLVCPAPTGSDYDSSTYTAYTPPGEGRPTPGGSAQMQPVAQSDGAGDNIVGAPAKPKPVVPLSAPGTPVTADAGKTTYPLIGSADGRFAPGWTVQETTTIDAGEGQGLLGTDCGQTGTEFWFPAASLAGQPDQRQDYLHLTNPDPTTAVADLELYDGNGPVKTAQAANINIPADSSVPVLLTSLTASQSADVTVHVTVRTGRVGAAVESLSAHSGGDWLPPSAPPADSAVLPGIPHDASAVHLVGYATGSNDAYLKVQLLTPTGPITPAGAETLHLKSGVTTGIDLAKLTGGQPGSLLLTPTDPSNAAPFVAALRVVRSKNHNEESAFIPATGPVGPRSTVADNESAGGSTISLTATTKPATVKIITSATTSGGTAVSKSVTLKPGTTVAMSPPSPNGSGSFAITVETVSGGPVYASRELSEPFSGLPAFTVQTMPDDGGFVDVPQADQDLSILEPTS